MASAEPSTLVKAGVGAQEFFSHCTHFRVGFDAENAIAVIEEELTEESGAEADVSNDVVGLQVAPLVQHIQNFARVAWAIAGIVRCTVGEALFGVGECHHSRQSLSDSSGAKARI